MNYIKRMTKILRNIPQEQAESIMLKSCGVGSTIGGIYGFRFGYNRSKNRPFGDHYADSIGGCALGVVGGGTFVLFGAFTIPVTAIFTSLRFIFPTENKNLSDTTYTLRPDLWH